METKIKVSKIIKPFYFFLFAILIEMVNFLWLGFKTSSGAIQVFPTYAILDLAIYLIFASIIAIVPNKWGNAIMYIFFSLQLLLSMVNATLYKVFGDIFSFDMIKLGGEAVAAFKFEFLDIWSIVLNLSILAVIITTQVLFDKKLKKEVSIKSAHTGLKRVSVIGLAMIMTSLSFYVQSNSFADSEPTTEVYESDQYLWDNMHLKLEAFKKFGTCGFYFKSLVDVVDNRKSLPKDEKTTIQDDLKNNQVEGNESAVLYGDNLIVVMLESFEWYAIDPFNTPTLWDIRTKSGISFENYYSKNKTNMSEDISILGNMPKDLVMKDLAKENLLNVSYSLPNSFKKLGYQANFFHSYKKQFYNRDIVNKDIGFENVYGIEDAELENKSYDFNDWNLDSEYIDFLMDKFIPTDSPFMSFFTTVTTHGSYNRTNERFQPYYDEYDKNLDEYKVWLKNETPYIYPEDTFMEKCFRQYKCAAMDTDKLISNILNNLKEKGLENNTTLVMFADHNCYYEDLCFHIKGTSKEDYFNIYNYNVQFMIYSPKLSHSVNNDFIGTYDIYPTICNLYGLPYNKMMVHGKNIFSSDIKDSIFVSYLTGVFNKNYYSSNISDVFSLNEANTDADLQAYKDRASEFFKKQNMIEYVYQEGYMALDNKKHNN